MTDIIDRLQQIGDPEWLGAHRERSEIAREAVVEIKRLRSRLKYEIPEHREPVLTLHTVGERLDLLQERMDLVSDLLKRHADVIRTVLEDKGRE